MSALRSGMMRNISAALAVTGFLSFMFLFLASGATAQTLKDKVGTEGKFRLEIAAGGGKGFDRSLLGYIVGTTERVEISGGGGLAGNVTAGYGVSSLFDVDLTFGLQRSGITDNVVNGDASFKRKYVLGTLKLKIPLVPKGDLFPSQIKLGGGIGYYFGGELEEEHTPLTGGPTNFLTVEYEGAIGYHATAELESFVTDQWTLVFSIRYYKVSYDPDNVVYNGVSLPSSALPADLQDFGGDGVDFYIGIGKYFSP